MIQKLQKKTSCEAFLASVSSINAAYARMQISKSPYNDEGIQSADEVIVVDLKFLKRSIYIMELKSS